MASIDKLKLGALDTEVRPLHHDRASIARQHRHQREVNDFLQDLADMQSNRRYNFAGDTIEGIYTTVDHSRVVTDGQRRAINNIRRGVGEREI